MPREAWRDDTEYLGLWRMARQQPEEGAPRFVLADWLEESGHRAASWRERLHGLTGSAPQVDPDTGVVRAGLVPLGQGAWRRLLAAPPADDLLCAFSRDVQAYRYLRDYQGRCGWDVGQSDWSSQTERSHLLAVPRLEMLACDLARPEDWDWVMDNLPGLTHFEARGPMIEAARLGALQRLPRLRGLSLRGRAAGTTTALSSLPGLRHLSLGPFHYEARRLAALAPQAESLNADPVHLGNAVLWPRLRSRQMLPAGRNPTLSNEDVLTLALHPHLERLSILCGGLTTALEALAGLPRLRELTLRFGHARPSSLKALAKAPALESLTVEGTGTEARIAEVAKIPGLRVLSLGSVETGRKGLAALARMPHLEELRLAGECEDAGAVAALARLPRLEKLDLKLLTMPPEASRAVKEACPPWVECLLPDAPG
jgi:uncharacterized protein (TIGR02996 family)